jgi:hypothetical protein
MSGVRRETWGFGCGATALILLAVLASVFVAVMMIRAVGDDDWLQAIFWLMLMFGAGSRVRAN